MRFFKVAHYRDFNGDGKADILWQNDSGQAAVWLKNGTTVLANNSVGTNLGTSWHATAGHGSGGGAQGDSVVNITGDAGANTIVGGSGNDILNSDGRADILTGGDGADKFVYAHVADSTVTMMDDITDFTQAQGDQINLHAFLLGNHNVTNASVGAFQGNSTAAGFFGTNSVAVQHFGGAEQVYVDVNHNGAFDPASDLVTHLDGITANLTATDFIF